MYNFASEVNRTFPSYLMPLFQNESSCETLHMKMSLIYMKDSL